MTALDPAIRDLLAAIRDLDERTRGQDDDRDWERSRAFAYASGVLRGMLEHGVQPRHATATIAAWAPWERVAEATEAGGS